MNSDKIHPHHRARLGTVYHRQSTIFQFKNNKGSQLRQSNMRETLLNLGWNDDTISDEKRDLGKSGSYGSKRVGWEALISAVREGKVGAVALSETSRAARNIIDIQTLIHYAALNKVLIILEDGIYDPSNIGDAMVLGLFGVINQTENALMVARMQAARLAKARNYTLPIPMPLGFVRSGKTWILDPNPSIQSQTKEIFERFEREQSIRGVVRSVIRDKFSILTRKNEELVELSPKSLFSYVRRVLTNPAYAGAYSYGRSGLERKSTSIDQEEIIKREIKPCSEWLVYKANHYLGYITQAQYEHNQRVITSNHRKKRSSAHVDPVSYGPSLLSGSLICAKCGFSLVASSTTREYNGKEHRYTTYSCSLSRHNGIGATCLTVSAQHIDAAVTQAILTAISPSTVGATLALSQKIDFKAQQQALEVQQTLLSAKKAAAVAENLYRTAAAHDPYTPTAQRYYLEHVQADAELARLHVEATAAAAPSAASVLTAEEKQLLAGLATELKRLWDHDGITQGHRKQLVRLLIKRIVVDRVGHACTLRLDWDAGATTVLTLDITPGRAAKTSSDLLNRIRDLSCKYANKIIANILNEEGYKSKKGLKITPLIVRRLRLDYNIRGDDRSILGKTTRTPKEVIDTIRDISPNRTRKEIADILNSRGILSCYGGKFSAASVGSIKTKHNIKSSPIILVDDPRYIYKRTRMFIKRYYRKGSSDKEIAELLNINSNHPHVEKIWTGKLVKAARKNYHVC